MIIAIPVENGRLHGHFGGCREFALVEVDEDKRLTLNTTIVSPPEHQPGLFPRWLREQGVQVVIAGGIGRRALAIFAEQGIAVRAGAADASIAPLVASYLGGQLTETPDSCEIHGDHHHHHHHGEDHNHDHAHGSVHDHQ